MKHFNTLALTVIALATTAADAATMQAFYTGTVLQSTDTTGLFGPPGTDLSGSSFTASFIYDTALGQLFANPNGTSLSGGSTLGLPSVFTSVTLSVGGLSLSLPGTSLARTAAQTVAFSIPPATSFDQFALDRILLSGGGWTDTSLITNVSLPGLGAFPTDLTTPFAVTGLAAGGGSTAVFRIQTIADPALPPPPVTASLAMIVDTLTVGAVAPAPVPLPAGGAALAAGLAMLAGAARRRKARKT